MKSFTLIILSLIAFSITKAQSFKIVIANFEDRTGVLAKTESQTDANIQAGAIVSGNAGIGTASGSKTEGTLESGKGDLGSQAADIFENELAKTGKFKVLDRNSFLRNLQKSESGEAVLTARTLGAHYLLTGNITEAGIKETGGSLLGFGGKEIQGRVFLNLKLINTITGEITLADNAEGIESVGGVKLFGSDVGGKKDLGLLISKALRNAVDSCLIKIQRAAGNLYNFPVECELGVSEGLVYLSKGMDDGVRIGDEFEVIGIGKTIKIGSKVIEEKVQKGKITVNSVENDYATAPAPFDFTINDGDKGVKVVRRVK